MENTGDLVVSCPSRASMTPIQPRGYNFSGADTAMRFSRSQPRAERCPKCAVSHSLSTNLEKKSRNRRCSLFQAHPHIVTSCKIPHPLGPIFRGSSVSYSELCVSFQCRRSNLFRILCWTIEDNSGEEEEDPSRRQSRGNVSPSGEGSGRTPPPPPQPTPRQRARNLLGERRQSLRSAPATASDGGTRCRSRNFSQRRRCRPQEESREHVSRMGAPQPGPF